MVNLAWRYLTWRRTGGVLAGDEPAETGSAGAQPYSHAMPDIHAARRARLQEQAAALGADAALITSLVNVRYLTGLASSNAALLLPAAGTAGAGTAVLATDSRYTPAAERDCPDVELIIERFTEPALAALAAARGWTTVAFEEHEMTVERHQALAGGGGLTLIPLGRLVEGLRMVKDEAEIALLARACEITVQCVRGRRDRHQARPDRARVRDHRWNAR